MRPVGSRGIAAALAIVLLLVASSAVAFWNEPGAGSSAVSTATFDAAAVGVPASAINLVTVTWSAQASLIPASPANSAITYSVERRLGSGDWAAVADGGCSGAQPRGTTSCDDAPPTAGSYGYRVVSTLVSWTATSQIAGPVTVTLDAIAPAVDSIVRLGSTPTGAGSVEWTVTFSEPVTGVGTGDFALARAGGLTGGSVGSVTGSGTSYTVTSSTGNGDGTLGLDLVDDDSIVDGAANKLGGTGTGNGNLAGELYVLDLTAPTVSSIARVGSTPTNAASVQWTVTFSEAVTGVGSTDVALTSTGSVSGASLTSVTGSGASYTVIASTGSGDGTLGLTLVDDDTITDAIGNLLGGTGSGNGNLTGQIFTIDRTAPALSSLRVFDTTANGKVDEVTATFSEAVVGSQLTQWTASGVVPSAGTLSSVSTSGAVATLVLAEGAGAADTAVGTFELALSADAAGIRDAAGNEASFAAAMPQDKAGPVPMTVSDGEGQVGPPTDGLLQDGDTLEASFSEPIASGLPASTPITESTPSGGGNTVLTITGFTDGALDMGSADYVTAGASESFTGAGARSNANKTVTITAGSCSASCTNLLAGSGATMVYRPAPTLLDAAGNSATGSALTGFKIF